VIQPVIDAADPDDIIVLGPGTYQENVVLWKPVILQGSGAAVTVIDNMPAHFNLPLKDAQDAKLLALEIAGVPFCGFANCVNRVPNQSSDYTLEQGAMIVVAGCDYRTGGANAPCRAATNVVSKSNFDLHKGAQIDGLTLTRAFFGGGVIVNGFAPNLKITNNEIFSNAGSIGGGVRVGEPALIGAGNPTGSSFNANVVIDHNRISENGSRFAGGGGVSIFGGADNYTVSGNMICGNMSMNYGGGISHQGLVGGTGKILDNMIVSNQSADEGGGIHIGGDNAPGATTLSPGAGNVLIRANLIQGNMGGDDGGGIRTRRINGAEVLANPANAAAWYRVDIHNNMVVLNTSANEGGGMAFDDTIKVNVIGNTVAHNDSTATSSGAFGPCVETSPQGQVCPTPDFFGGLQASNPTVAGISSFAHTAALWAAMTTGATAYCNAAGTHATETICARWSNPVLRNDIVYQNRSFYWDPAANSGLGLLRPKSVLGGSNYWDFGVYGMQGVPLPPAPPPQSCTAATANVCSHGAQFCVSSARPPRNPASATTERRRTKCRRSRCSARVTRSSRTGPGPCRAPPTSSARLLASSTTCPGTSRFTRRLRRARASAATSSWRRSLRTASSATTTSPTAHRLSRTAARCPSGRRETSTTGAASVQSTSALIRSSRPGEFAHERRTPSSGQLHRAERRTRKESADARFESVVAAPGGLGGVIRGRLAGRAARPCRDLSAMPVAAAYLWWGDWPRQRHLPDGRQPHPEVHLRSEEHGQLDRSALQESSGRRVQVLQGAAGSCDGRALRRHHA
jgi:hypothetical protein